MSTMTLTQCTIFTDMAKMEININEVIRNVMDSEDVVTWNTVCMKQLDRIQHIA